MAEDYIAASHTWSTSETITAARLNGNVSNLIDGLSGGTKAVNVGKVLMNGTETITSARVATFTDLTVDNIAIDGNTISADSGNVVLGSLTVEDTTAGITAGTTQTQAGATALTSNFNEVGTVANDEDGVALPTAVAGLKVSVLNNGANILKIWPATSDNLGKGVDTGLTIATGTTAVFEAYDATNWHMVNKHSEINHTVHVSTGAGFGSSSTRIRRIETSITNTGTAISVVNSATLGTVFTVHEDGLYSMTYQDDWSGGLQSIGISKNSSQLTTSITGITSADLLVHTTPVSAVGGACSVTAYLAAGDVIRPHTGGSQDSTNANETRFLITKIS